jgi:hypothetical protein
MSGDCAVLKICEYIRGIKYPDISKETGAMCFMTRINKTKFLTSSYGGRIDKWEIESAE